MMALIYMHHTLDMDAAQVHEKIYNVNHPGSGKFIRNSFVLPPSCKKNF